MNWGEVMAGIGLPAFLSPFAVFIFWGLWPHFNFDKSRPRGV